MTRQQRVALGAGPAVVLTMVPIYLALLRVLPREWAWMAGFLVYWSAWCVAFPLVLLGPRRVAGMFRRPRWDAVAAVFAVVPVLVALLGRFVPHGETPSPLPPALLAATSCVMGVLEEVLWRGVYLELFPASRLWGIAWPSLWYALWHVAPGLASPLDGRVLVGGAALFGVVLGFIAQRTRSIRWPVATHAAAGLVRML
ncbi:MAG TPA: CPBP family intramembrane glutamic endopeptidase [Myxococcaceae bacterium]|nr:CPBP family intramembrane glutamic endopeptidase [Myxococcaceae bacterium]